MEFLDQQQCAEPEWGPPSQPMGKDAPPVPPEEAIGTSARGSLGCAESVFDRFAQPGVEEDSTRATCIEGLMPNCVRSTRGNPTSIQLKRNHTTNLAVKRRARGE